ncbi:MAG: hypothetical protein NTZ48_07085 [Candidatus Omnitrophica bacterium]|nr:hypothetical protein [Candidatus Omnitrophota bacterium]
MDSDERKELHKKLLDAMNINVFSSCNNKQMNYTDRVRNLKSIGADFGLDWEQTQWEMFKARIGVL